MNVHFVPHTHNDVGWLKTVDQYYYGSRYDLDVLGICLLQGLSLIFFGAGMTYNEQGFNISLTALSPLFLRMKKEGFPVVFLCIGFRPMCPRRFIYVESAFFWRWWNEQTDAKKDIVRGLVNQGRYRNITM